ncbi:MAG: galactose-1-phosphate uridylyltransferase, partial [Clostridia bacterium]|nr:galactose-1-phosphate uridylyltransferase [Clostridia bacterium]
RGEPVGVTMPHPHGQIYGYSYVPKKLEVEIDSSREHFEKTGKCLFCDILKNEQDYKQRVIFENEDFITFLPFFTDYPYGVYIAAKNHMQNLSQFTDSQKDNLAQILKETTGMLDSLFDYPFPYMMCMHQDPVNGEDCSDFFHFHIEFFPPMRAADKQKFNASSETGAWAACNPTAPEEKADELRAAHKKFLEKMANE